MSNNNLAGFPAFGPRVDTVITYHPQIITFETPIELPTGTYPETPQIEFTLTAEMEPTFSGPGLPFASGANWYSKFMCYIFAYFVNSSGGSATCYAQSKRTVSPTWGGFGNAILDLTLNFTCPRPFWQGYFNIGSTAGNVGGGGAALSVPFSVVGSVPARPQIVLYSAAGLSVETGKKVTLSIGSLSLDWTGSIPAAGYVVFDCASGQAFSSEAMPAEGAIVWDGDTTTNKAAGLLDTSDWASRQWAFPTGDYALSVSSDQTAAAAITAYIRFSNEYYG